MPGTPDTRLASVVRSLELSAAEHRSDPPEAFEALYPQHFDFVFRCVRRLGINGTQLGDYLVACGAMGAR